jgi:formylglycine-generating enzyme required for sulfatase activity
LVAAAVLVVILAGFIAGYRERAHRGRLERARQLLDKGVAALEDLPAIHLERQRIAERLRPVARDELPEWLPEWERGEESELLTAAAALAQRLSERHSDAKENLEKASQEAPDGSPEAERIKRALEDVGVQLYRIADEDGQVQISQDFFRREIESLDLGTYAEELKGNGEALIATDPPGAEVFCFRYEEIERRLVPLPFNPSLGLEDPARGLAGRPFLRVDRGWGPKAAPFQAGDRLLRLGGAEPRTPGEFARALAGIAAGAPVEVEVEREGDARRFDWTPFPPSFYETREALKPGKVHDFRFQFDITFEGYPLENAAGARAGVTPTGAPLKVTLPRGSYLFLVRKEGHADARVPFVAPRGASPPTIRLWKKEDVPEGFIHVPAGEFSHGGDDQAYDSLEKGRVTLGDFFIARSEVTFGEYLEFVNDRARRGDLDENGRGRLEADWESPELREFRAAIPERVGLLPQFTFSNPPTFKASVSGSGYDLGDESHRERPIVGISMVAAVEYAHWMTRRAGGRWRFRLPRDLEWEKAARGVDRRPYVWGREFLWSFANLGLGRLPDEGPQVIEPSGARPYDESVYGVRDLAGSAAEPTTGQSPRLLRGSRQYFIYRGGYWIGTDPRDVRIASRNRTRVARSNDHLGIRLVADPPG